MGPIECSVHIDNIGKESLKPHMEPYTYKNEVEIPALGWIDDLITVSESGYKTARINAFINAQIASKKLRLGAKKCFMMHVGNKHEDYKNTQLYVDGWDFKKIPDSELHPALVFDSNSIRCVESKLSSAWTLIPYMALINDENISAK